jgi:O-antigen ligase
MLDLLFILCALIWLPILLYQMTSRSFAVVAIWFLIAPVASNIVNYPSNNPIFNTSGPVYAPESQMDTLDESRTGGQLKDDNRIRLNQLLEPTRTLLWAILVIFLLNALGKRIPLEPLDRTELYMIVFSVILLVGVFLQSGRLHWSLRMTSDAFISPFLGYYVMRRLITSEERQRRLIQVLGYMGCYVIIISLLERLLHPDLFHRLSGPFRTGSTLHAVLATVFFVVLAESFGSRGLPDWKWIFPRKIRWFVLCLLPVVIILTWSRGNWAGFCMGIAVFWFLGLRLLHLSWKIATFGLILILVPVIVVSIPIVVPVEMFDVRIGNTGTIYGRFATWLVALQEGASHPLFGIGLDNLTQEVLIDTHLRIQEFGNFDSVHQSFLQIFAEQGVLGLLAYLAILGSIFRKGLRLYRSGPELQDRWRGVAVVAIMVAYLIPGFFASTLHVVAVLHHIFVYAYVGGVAGRYGQQFSTSRLYAIRRPSVRRPQVPSHP